MKLLLFGTGEYYNRYKIWFENEQVLALIDNSPSKQGTIIDGTLVISPLEASKMNVNAIFIMSFYIVEMKKQLIELGFPAEKIYHFYDIHDLIYNQKLNKKIMFYGEHPKSADKGILLLNSDLTLGGPALALFQVAKILKKHGYNVTYGSQLDGPLRQVLQQENIPVVVDLNLMVQTMKECRWVKDYSLILCNTINFHIFISSRDIDIPMIWWLHDSPFFYDGINKRAIDAISEKNLKIWSVGIVAKEAITTFRPDFHVENLLYGVEDVADGLKKENITENPIMKFSTIGYIERRKGQDVLIEAIRKIPDNIRKRAKFTLVGQNTSLLAFEIMEKCKAIKEIEFTGTVNRDMINKILIDSDILICPSREDPMPTVCAEAMMHNTPCIISNAAGTAEYITDLEDGFVFQSENSDELANKIIWAVKHRNEIAVMGHKSRKVFERNFIMHIFEKKLLELMELPYDYN